MDDAIIIGAGTYGQVYAEYIKDSGNYTLVGFLDDDVSKHHTVINGLPVLGGVTFLETLSDRKNTAVFCPIGNNTIRINILQKVKELGYQTPSFVHSDVQIHPTVNLGKCVYILPSTNIMPLTTIEDFVMISMGVNIAHHTTIGKGSFLSQGVNVGASINIGEKSFLGIASTIMTGIKSIGQNTLIGAGAVVVKDVPDDVVVAGVPARVIRMNSRV